MLQVSRMPKVRPDSHNTFEFDCVHAFQAVTIRELY